MTNEEKAREIVDRYFREYGTPPPVQAAKLDAMIAVALTKARREERERCAAIARDACLVPPDGGSMTEEERRICEDIDAAIMRDPDYLPWEDAPRALLPQQGGDRG